VSIRGFNNTGVWHNGEGWELDHALRQVRAWFPRLVIHVKPDDELPLVVIAPDEPLGSAADWR
jgi:hypothetical protein